MCSRTLSVWPNLGKLVNRWAFQKLKDFPYTTIQFNKNYTAKMHVDGNNHGWSYIIGLGDYSGGELWLYDPKAHAEMEVKDTMRGFPELKVGMMARGKVVSIKNTWIKFDGNCPHAVYPFEGKRISIVLFTRQRWLNMRAEHKEKLMGFGFPIPGDEYMLVCTDREKRILLNSPSLSATPSAKRVKMEESDDEVDEEEQLDAALRQDEEGNTTLWRARAWAAQFQQFLGVAWGNKSVGSDPIRIVTSCTGPGPTIALQDLIPPGCSKLAAATEVGSVAMKIVAQNCTPVHAFAELDSAVDGHGFCEVIHQEAKDVDLSATDRR